MNDTYCGVISIFHIVTCFHTDYEFMFSVDCHAYNMKVSFYSLNLYSVHAIESTQLFA